MLRLVVQILDSAIQDYSLKLHIFKPRRKNSYLLMKSLFASARAKHPHTNDFHNVNKLLVIKSLRLLSYILLDFSTSAGKTIETVLCFPKSHFLLGKYHSQLNNKKNLQSFIKTALWPEVAHNATVSAFRLILLLFRSSYAECIV